MNPDGTNQKRLTFTSGHQGWPAWSPDGTRISFRNGNRINIMNADGSGLTELSCTDGATEGKHSWSPDGSKLAVSRKVGGRPEGEIYLVKSDCSDSDRIFTDGTAFDPDWSPDGSQIAFRSTRDNSNSEIYVMDINGSGLTRLTNSGGYDGWPDWSPDGQLIAYYSELGGIQTAVPSAQVSVHEDHNTSAHAMNGNGMHGPIMGASSSVAPSWSPDGTMIVYASLGEIYVQGDSGGYQLTSNGTEDSFPSWGPP